MAGTMTTGRRALLALVVLALAGASCSAAATSTSAPPAPPSAAPSSLPIRTIASTAIPALQVTDMSVSGGTIWMITGSTTSTLDPATKTVTETKINTCCDELDGIEVTDSAVWLADFGASEVIRADKSGSGPLKRIPVGAAEDVLAVGGTIWVTNHHEGSISRIDATSGAVLGTEVIGQAGHNGPQRLAQGDGSVWVDESNTSEVIRLDPATGKVVARISVPDFPPCGGILVTEQAVWATGCHDSPAMVRIDPATNNVAAVVVLDAFAQDVVDVNGTIWVPVGGSDFIAPGQSSAAAGELERVDPLTNTVTTKLTTDGLDDVAGSVVVGDSLWLSNGSTSVLQIPLSELAP